MKLEAYETWYQDERKKKEAFTSALLALCKEYEVVPVYDCSPRLEVGKDELYDRLEKQLQWWAD